MSIDRSDLGRKLLDSQNTHLDEDRILESITRLRAEFNRIESTTGPSRRSSSIREEIKRLGYQLVRCKKQAQESAGQASQGKPGN